MLNSNEIRLLLSELNLEGSFIQKVSEHDYHSFTFSMFSKEEKAFLLYFEIGTRTQHFCRTGIMRKKSDKAQRFTQYMRANITGSRITEVKQIDGERVFYFTLVKAGEVRRIYFRFFSGPGSNVIITDGDDIILEVLMRRPKRGEERGWAYNVEEAKAWDEERFPVRQWEGESFNSFIDHYYSNAVREEKTDAAYHQLEEQTRKEISALESQLRDVRERVRRSSSYESYRESADLLSSFSYMVRKGESSVLLTDFSGSQVRISLDPSLSVSGNINTFYQKYKREERIYASAVEEQKNLESRLEEKKKFHEELTSRQEHDLRELTKNLRSSQTPARKTPLEAGLRFESFGFEILVGRNATENDTLLRRNARSGDTWLHTRDYAGGYVIIRGRKDKSIPLDVLLDAGCLAIHYSKAKTQGKADLYYTKVKYLRRVKDGKLGLVVPTNEKNLYVTLDEERIKRLLLSKEEKN